MSERLCEMMCLAQKSECRKGWLLMREPCLAQQLDVVARGSAWASSFGLRLKRTRKWHVK